MTQISIQELKDQGPQPRPEQELWPDINPYQQKWLSEEIGKDNFKRLLQLPTVTERKTELANMTEARVATLKQNQSVNDRELLAAMQALGDRQMDCGRTTEAEKTYDALLNMYQKLGTDPKGDLREAYNLAHLNFRMGRYVEAERLYREALPYVSGGPLGTDSPQYLGAWRAIIEAVTKQGGRWDDARRLLNEGFDLVRGMKGGEWHKFEAEELEAMEEVRDMVIKAELDAGQSRPSETAKL